MMSTSFVRGRRAEESAQDVDKGDKRCFLDQSQIILDGETKYPMYPQSNQLRLWEFRNWKRKCVSIWHKTA